MTTTTRHPSYLALERYLLDPTASPLHAHVAACGECRGRVERMEEDGRHFRQFVYPASVARIEAAARRRPARRWLAVLAPISALAAAVALVIVAPSGPPADYVGVKGGVGLAAFVRRDGAAAAVEDGAAVPATAALRLRVRTPAPCRLFVLSVDGAGSVSRLDAAGADGASVGAGQHDLAAGVELDGRAGPERLFAVCAPAGVSWAEIERAARAGGAGGPDRVRATTGLGGLPPGAVQATLLLEKVP